MKKYYGFTVLEFEKDLTSPTRRGYTFYGVENKGVFNLSRPVYPLSGTILKEWFLAPDQLAEYITNDYNHYGEKWLKYRCVWTTQNQTELEKKYNEMYQEKEGRHE